MGALATGAELTFTRPNPPYSHLEHHAGLAEWYRHNAEDLGRSFYDGPVPPVSTDMGTVSLRPSPGKGEGYPQGIVYNVQFANFAFCTQSERHVI